MTDPADVPPHVRTERRGHVLLITLDRPESRNAVDAGVAQGLEAAIDELEGTADLWVGVLTGSGPVFCAGADLKAIAAGGAADLTTARGNFAGFVRRERTKPVIAALQGDALAGGCEIAIASDLIVAEEHVHLGIPEVKRSLLAVAGALANLPRLAGEKVALEMALTGEKLPVQRLHEIGLVNRVVPTGSAVDEAIALAEQICENAPLAVRASREIIVGGRDASEDERWQRGYDEMARLAATDDFREGPLAFVEKRAPNWKGR